MSHVSECIQLYRHDLTVTPSQYARMIEDAHERDLADEARAEAPDDAKILADVLGMDHGAVVRNLDRARALAEDAPPIEPLWKPSRSLLNCTSCNSLAWFSEGKCEHCAATIGTARLNGPDERSGEPADVARLILDQWEQLVTALEEAAEMIALLNRLDSKRAADIADLTDAVEFLGNRMNLRADECRALGNRIDNLTRTVNARGKVSP
jgi:hypothetical protein